MKRFALLALAAIVLTNSGCHLFSKKKKAAPTPKESSHVAVDVENDFMRRWIDKRTAELVAQAVPAADAKRQATDEFKQRFSYTDAARKLP
jgi:hypothetical protein